MGSVHNMGGGNIVESIKVDRSCTSWGLPWCAPGKQPTVENETFGYSGLSDVVNKLNGIFKVSFKF